MVKKLNKWCIGEKRINTFSDMYDKLENELKQVISTEDKNPSSLHNRFDQFQQKVENINDLIKVLQNAR